MSSDFRTVDLFCGGGGLSQGLAEAGFDVVAAFDSWPSAVEFYNRNIHTHKAHLLDLECVEDSISEIRKWAPSVIAGGPPCQDFSSAGKRDETGSRANLTLAFSEIVTAVRPPVFIMENVERALKTSTFKTALATFREAGYSLSISVLDASLCQVPQRRKRTVVVGFLDRSAASLVSVYKRLQSDRPMTLRDYFGDSLGIECYYRHPRSYARRGVFSIDEPSPTIRGVNRPIPKGYTGHEGDVKSVFSEEVRPLTTKERSLIQTFPKEWELVGGKSDLEQIIGNAVPVRLAAFVGRAIKEYLADENSYASVDLQPTFVFEQKVSYGVD